MSASLQGSTCAVCGAPNSQAPGAVCGVCGINTEWQAFDLGLARAAPSPAAVSPRPAQDWAGLFRTASVTGGIGAAATGTAFAVFLLLLKPALTGSFGIDASVKDILIAGLAAGILLGMTGGVIWSVVRTLDLGLPGGAAAGAAGGAIIAVAQQVAEQALVFGTSDHSILLTALLGAAAGAVCGAMVAAFHQRI